jgi:myosin heavy subunit
MEGAEQQRRRDPRGIPAPPYMHIVQPEHEQARDHDDNVSEYQDDMTVRTERTMDDNTARRKYGLNNWRKYALYKHGNNPKFLNSAQGREILKTNFRLEAKRDLDALSDWVQQVDYAAGLLEEELHETRVENAALVAKAVDTERLLGIQDQMRGEETDDAASPESDANKIQYVVLLEKKLSVSAWEIEELRAEVAALKQQKNSDAVVNRLRQQLESATVQRDELLSDRGSRARGDEERERSLVAQLEELSRARAEMALECSRVESDSANRVESLFTKLEVVQRQRDDLLSEQRLWRREREEMNSNMAAQVSDLTRQKEQLMAENLHMRQQIVHLTPINVEASSNASSSVSNNNRFRAAPSSLQSASASTPGRKPDHSPPPSKDAVPEKKPPSASLKAKLEEWNRQRDRIAEETAQQASREQVREGKLVSPTSLGDFTHFIRNILSYYNIIIINIFLSFLFPGDCG